MPNHGQIEKKDNHWHMIYGNRLDVIRTRLAVGEFHVPVSCSHQNIYLTILLEYSKWLFCFRISSKPNTTPRHSSVNMPIFRILCQLSKFLSFIWSNIALLLALLAIEVSGAVVKKYYKVTTKHQKHSREWQPTKHGDSHQMQLLLFENTHPKVQASLHGSLCLIHQHSTGFRPRLLSHDGGFRCQEMPLPQKQHKHVDLFVFLRACNVFCHLHGLECHLESSLRDLSFRVLYHIAAMLVTSRSLRKRLRSLLLIGEQHCAFSPWCLKLTTNLLCSASISGFIVVLFNYLCFLSEELQPRIQAYVYASQPLFCCRPI